jgi:ABC-2 type transport system ATP-binding protein
MLRYDSVTFSYGCRRGPVLDAFDWTVPPGRTVLLGPNGAGKSTLLALGADALRPQRGVVSTADGAGLRRLVGWMPQSIQPISGLSCREQVAYAGWLKGLGRRTAWQRSAGALDRVGLADLAERRPGSLSGGQLRRLGLAQVLVHEPGVLLLDEPTAGLDPAQRARFRQLVDDLAVPMLVSTHQVDDLSARFDTVVVLLTGCIAFQGSVPEFFALAPHGVAEGRRAEAAYFTLTGGEH